VPRHHLNETALIVGERTLRGRVRGEDAEHAIAIHSGAPDRTCELHAAIVQIKRGVGIVIA